MYKRITDLQAFDKNDIRFHRYVTLWLQIQSAGHASRRQQ